MDRIGVMVIAALVWSCGGGSTASGTDDAALPADGAGEAATADAAKPPSAPLSVTAQAGSNANAKVSWLAPLTDATTEPVTGYVITAVPAIAETVVGPDATHVVVGGLTGGIDYTFTVAASNAMPATAAEGPGSSSEPVAIVGPPQPPWPVLATNPQEQSMTVSWAAPTNQGGAGHPVFQYFITPSDGSAQRFDCGGPACPATSTTTATELTDGTLTTFTVVAVNDLGPSSPSVMSNALTPAGLPDPPTNLTATPGDGSITVHWTPAAPHGSAITSYTFYNGGDIIGGCVVPGACVSSFVVPGLTNGQAITLDMESRNGVGDSLLSQAVIVTPTSP